MIGPRALFGSAFALVAVGMAMGLSDPGGTPRSGAPVGMNAAGDAPAEAGKARGSGGSATTPAGKPGAVATAWSAVENDKLTTGSAGASRAAAESHVPAARRASAASGSTAGLLGAGTGDRPGNQPVEGAGRIGGEPAQTETAGAPEGKREIQDPHAPKPAARARSPKPAVSAARSQGLAAQRQREAPPEATTIAGASAPRAFPTGSPRVIDEAAFLR